MVATLAPLADIVHNAGGGAGGRDRARAAHAPTRTSGARAPRSGRRCGTRTWSSGPAARIDRWAAEAGGERTLGLLPLVDPLGDDPHWWQDPVRVERAAKEIRNELARADVNGAGYYEAATADFLARLRKLHRDMRICMSLLPHRRARAWRPSTTGSPTSTTATAPRSSARAGAARPWGGGCGPTRSGEPGTPAGSYLGAMAANTATIVRGADPRRGELPPRAVSGD